MISSIRTFIPCSPGGDDIMLMYEAAATKEFPNINTAVSYIAALVYHVEHDDLLHLIVKYGRKIVKVSTTDLHPYILT